MILLMVRTSQAILYFLFLSRTCLNDLDSNDELVIYGRSFVDHFKRSKSFVLAIFKYLFFSLFLKFLNISGKNLK